MDKSMEYKYSVTIDNSMQVRVDKYSPEGHPLGTSFGQMGLGGEAGERIYRLYEQARQDKLSREEAIELGENLFLALFDPGLRGDFFTFYDNARKQAALLHVELDIDEGELPELAALPWEYLRIPDAAGEGSGWFARNPNLVFTRSRPASADRITIRTQQDIGSAGGEVAGTVLDGLGDNTPPGGLNAKTTQKIDKVERGGKVVGTIIGGEGEVQVGDRHEQQYGGVRVGDISNVSGGQINIAGGDISHIQSGQPRADAVTQLFAGLKEKINALVEGPDKTLALTVVEELEREARKGLWADEKSVRRWLLFLSQASEDVYRAALEAFGKPVPRLSPVFRQVAEEARGSQPGE